MDQEEVVDQPTGEEVVTPTEETPEVVAAPEPPVKQKFVVPVTDDDGNEIPGVQPNVYYYTDAEDLQKQLAKSISTGTRRIHELKKRVSQPPTVPEGAEVQEPQADYKPRELTEDEKFIIKTEPEKAFDIMHKARYGMTPEEKAKRDRQAAEDAATVRAKAETDMFKEEHEDYYPCRENMDAIINWFQQRPQLAWRAKNLDLAYRQLKADGLLVEKPAAQPPVQPTTVETRTEAPPSKGPEFPTAIRNGSTRATAPREAKKGPSAAEMEMMSADELKKLHPELQQAR